MEKLKIKNKDFNILKAYIQTQLLLNTLDDVEDESRMNIKHATKKYKSTLESKVTEVIKNTFNSNKELFDKILTDVDNGISGLNKYFDVI